MSPVLALILFYLGVAYYMFMAVAVPFVASDIYEAIDGGMRPDFSYYHRELLPAAVVAGLIWPLFTPVYVKAWRLHLRTGGRM